MFIWSSIQFLRSLIWLDLSLVPPLDDFLDFLTLSWASLALFYCCIYYFFANSSLSTTWVSAPSPPLSILSFISPRLRQVSWSAPAAFSFAWSQWVPSALIPGVALSEPPRQAEAFALPPQGMRACLGLDRWSRWCLCLGEPNGSWLLDGSLFLGCARPPRARNAPGASFVGARQVLFGRCCWRRVVRLWPLCFFGQLLSCFASSHYFLSKPPDISSPPLSIWVSLADLLSL